MRKLLLVGLLALGACAPPLIMMNKRGATEASWKVDDFACMQEAYAAGGGVMNQYGRYTREPNPGMYQKCMEARGYVRTN